MIGRAYAKVNFYLEVVGKRSNGYHDLHTVMTTIDLYDTVTIEKEDGQDRQIRILCNDASLPVGSDNIIYRAVCLMYDITGRTQNVCVTLDKRIPVAAGLGGGSADAACVLRMLNRQWCAKLDTKTLADQSVVLGADVPFAIYGNVAFAGGIGEKIQPIALKDEVALVLICPNIKVSTKSVFEQFRFEAAHTDQGLHRVIKALKTGNVENLGQSMFNRLEEITLFSYPVLQEYKQALLCAGACGALMSGSGPTLFGVFSDREKASHAARQLAFQKPQCRVIKTMAKEIAKDEQTF